MSKLKVENHHKIMKEIWKDIPGYEGLYKVSNKGRVRVLDRTYRGKNNNSKDYYYYTQKGRIMKASLNKRGYPRTQLFDGIKPKSHYVHRLVAMAFLPDYSEDLTVNHLDGNKLNNTPENLEMCTNLENMRHAYREGIRDQAHAKKMLLNAETGIYYDSIKEATESTPYCYNYIQMMLRGVRTKKISLVYV